MNAKRCKKIRKALRAKGIDPREARHYVPKGRVFKKVQTLTGVVSFWHPGTTELYPSCGRFMYQMAKSHFADFVL